MELDVLFIGTWNGTVLVPVHWGRAGTEQSGDVTIADTALFPGSNSYQSSLHPNYIFI